MRGVDRRSAGPQNAATTLLGLLGETHDARHQRDDMTMKMRTALTLSAGMLGASLVAPGCFVKEGESGGGGGGTTPSTECQAGCKVVDADGGDYCVPVEGECIDDKTIRSCFVSEEFETPPEVIEATCEDYESCGTGINGAECQVNGECYPGETRCADASTLETCENGAWSQTACGGESCISQPGLGAQCLSQAAGSGIFLAGKLEFEYLRRNSSLTDFDTTPAREDAIDFFVTVFDLTDGELIGMDLTGAGVNKDPGTFNIEVSRPVNDQTFIYFWPMLFDQAGQPRLAMAKAESDDAIHQYSEEYWWWGYEVCPAGTGECGTADLGTLLIDIESGSGAANIYRWLDYGVFSFEELFPGVQALTAAVFWNPGIAFNCGNCFVPPAGGGSKVKYDFDNDLSDHYQSTINISGTGGSPTQWAKSVLNHEFGHWSMQSYTKSPGEGGVHYVDAASLPGLSYSEGYATFTGQRNISNSPGDNEPIYFTKKNGTTFWVDISDNTWSGGSLEKPNASGPIDQDVNENVIASMFWSMWASQNAEAPQGLGDAPVFETIRHNRLLQNDQYNRGYTKVDMLDYLDAMICGATATEGQVADVASSVSYPWDGNPTCP